MKIFEIISEFFKGTNTRKEGPFLKNDIKKYYKMPVNNRI